MTDAADKPQYNADFTEMTARLRKGIYWNDGIDADDCDFERLPRRTLRKLCHAGKDQRGLSSRQLPEGSVRGIS